MLKKIKSWFGKRFVLFALLCFAFFSFSANAAVALTTCNTNDHCMLGWVCIGGVAANGSASRAGVCKPNIVVRQLCYVHSVATGTFGKAIVAMALIAMSLSFFLGKIEFGAFLTTIIGTVLVFGSLQFITVITRDYRAVCNFKLAPAQP